MWVEQYVERKFHDALDFSRLWRPMYFSRCRGQPGRHQEVAGVNVAVWKLPNEIAADVGAEFFGQLASGRSGRRLAGLHDAAWQTDLAAVSQERARPLGEWNVPAAGAAKEQHNHGGRASRGGRGAEVAAVAQLVREASSVAASPAAAPSIAPSERERQPCG
jgi:hypothetical protein